MGSSTPNHRKGRRDVIRSSVGSHPRPSGNAYGLYLEDLSHDRTQSHGIVNYALGLATALAAALRLDERLVLFANREIAAALPASGESVEVVGRRPPPRGVGRVLGDQAGALVAARRHGVDVLHFPKGFVPLVNPTHVKVVATLHDDIPLRYWEGRWGTEHRTLRTGYFAWNLRHSAVHADCVLTVSEFTRSQLQQRWPRVVATVTGQSVSLPRTEFVPVSRRRPYAVMFGSALPHKRSADGLNSILGWLDAHPQQGVDEIQVIGALPDGTLHDPRVRVLPGGHSNDDVARLIAEARVVLFPSEYEGFGLPPLEATLAGTPVVFARIPVMAEVLGAAAPGGFDTGQPASFAMAMAEALRATDDDLTGRATAAAQRHRWDDVAAATLAAYRAVLKGPGTTGR